MTGTGSAAPHSDLPVVVGVDGSRDATAAARLGAREAAFRSAPLRLVLAFPWAQGDRIPAPEGFDAWAVLRASADFVLGSLEAMAREEAPGLRVESRLADGPAVDVLVAESETAQLLCVGSTSTGGVGDLLLGSTASAVVRLSRCPVLVVPQRPGTAVSERSGVVVGLDGTSDDDPVLAFALRAAADRSTELVAVHTWEHMAPGPVGLLADPLMGDTAARRRAEALLTDSLDRAGVTDVPVRRVVEPGRPAEALLAVATTAQLLVVGHRHRRGGALGVLRSVTNAVLHRAACPVAVVPLPARADRAVASVTAPAGRR
ncbi:Nucleotide-binding universal stress protein, UspA family [Geodermatophilus obscurus]|uniref:Nucleotide-binding universal stress protein, UspA family n=1 Tax=Geodermatophilus obscurus TaxID=1861 RepID=A0A1M7UZH3_9ACTN|nr:universal stress protein [Geodermatophilus obscurus]SHN88369.1 Nucleotide-binding universal stress protein, UspA family [Geodermatophilus obscurus]